MMSSLVSEEARELAKNYNDDIEETQFLFHLFVRQYSQEFGWKYIHNLDEKYSSKKDNSILDSGLNDIVVEINDSSSVPRPDLNDQSLNSRLDQWYNDFEYGVEQHGSLQSTVELAYSARHALQRLRVVKDKSEYGKGHTNRDSFELTMGAPYRKAEHDLILVAEDKIKTVTKGGNVFPVIKHAALSSQNDYLKTLYDKARKGDEIPTVPFFARMGVPCIKIRQVSQLWDEYEKELLEHLEV